MHLNIWQLRALEPTGGALIDAMSIVAAIRSSDRVSTIASATPPRQYR
jgi:hypothetical protein